MGLYLGASISCKYPFSKLQPLESDGSGSFVVDGIPVDDVVTDNVVVDSEFDPDVVTGNVDDVVTGPLAIHFRSGSDIFPFLHFTIFVA